MTEKNKAKLEDAYVAAHIRALTLLEDLHQTIEDLPAPDQDNNRIDWGHVGSLQHICDQVVELKRHFQPTR